MARGIKNVYCKLNWRLPWLKCFSTVPIAVSFRKIKGYGLLFNFTRKLPYLNEYLAWPQKCRSKWAVRSPAEVYERHSHNELWASPTTAYGVRNRQKLCGIEIPIYSTWLSSSLLSFTWICNKYEFYDGNWSIYTLFGDNASHVRRKILRVYEFPFFYAP